MRRHVLFLLVLGIALMPTVVSAATYGSNVYGLAAQYNVPPDSDLTADEHRCYGLAWDTQNMVNGEYDRLYIANRGKTASSGTMGLWATSISGGQASFQRVSELAAGQPAKCVAVDDAGSVYVGYTGYPEVSPYVYKVMNPLTPSQSVAVSLADYGDVLGNAGDDDVEEMCIVPQGFGGTASFDQPGYDVVLFDDNYDNTGTDAILLMDKYSSDSSPRVEVLWQNSSNWGGFRGDAGDGYIYAMPGTLLTDTVGSETLPYILRVDGDGNAERVFLGGIDFTVAGYATRGGAMAVNPADGSVWFILNKTVDGQSGYTMVRVDAHDATLVSGSDYVADTTAEIVTPTGDSEYLYIATNALAISPDGKYLAMTTYPYTVGTLDIMQVYNLIPEPATMALLTLGSLLVIRRKK